MPVSLDHVALSMCAAGGLNDQVLAITAACINFNIPVVFALSRRALARAVGKHSRVSIVGLLSLDDVADKFKVRGRGPAAHHSSIVHCRRLCSLPTHQGNASRRQQPPPRIRTLRLARAASTPRPSRSSG